MGAIDFSISSFILNVFGAYCHILDPDYFISYWDLNDFHGRSDINNLKHATQRKDFRPSSHQCWSWQPLSSLIFLPPCLLPTSMLDILRQNRSEPLLKINIEREQKGRGVDGAGNWKEFLKFSGFFLSFGSSFSSLVFSILCWTVLGCIDEFFRFCFFMG